MKPSIRYQEFMQSSGFLEDPTQAAVVTMLDRLQDEILTSPWQEKHWLRSLQHRFGRGQDSIRGLYLWGGVGRGKTLLMDIFFETLPVDYKKRIHFHAFMNMIHEGLRECGPVANPLQSVARDFARDIRVLCLDEFIVTDIGDAMLIGQLLGALFERGIILVTTSNSPPGELYRDGLQRSRFLPAIDLLNQHTLVTNLDGGRDYRLLGLKDTELYRYPHDERIEGQLLEYLKSHHVMTREQGEIEINHRLLRFEFCAEDSIWFSFENLCLTARSRHDYLELARQFSTVVLTDIRTMGGQNNDVAKRFISLIDMLYDHRVKLICSAEAAAHELYAGGMLAGEFERTVSRLLEMQGREYWQQPHRAD